MKSKEKKKNLETGFKKERPLSIKKRITVKNVKKTAKRVIKKRVIKKENDVIPKGTFLVEAQPCVIKKNGKRIAVVGLRLGAGHTMNLGDFESARFDATIGLVPMDNVSVEEMAEAGWDEVMKQLKSKIGDVLNKQKIKREAKREKAGSDSG